MSKFESFTDTELEIIIDSIYMAGSWAWDVYAKEPYFEWKEGYKRLWEEVKAEQARRKERNGKA